jgi:hypothetical protein
LREAVSDMTAPEDEGDNVNGLLSAIDGVEHRTEDLVTVAQNIDGVALRCVYAKQ